uniref:Uncharacterized protein n=1 Tax=Tanacetum cinerariifolium TaxID=118510 RepID=A0A6L2LMR7_TANCI|nr:hypothetical protein [Tanacetum cinerariifolium]
MDPNSSLEKIYLGDDVVVISSYKVEGSGDWNSPEYQDTAISKGKKVVNTLSFYRIEMDEISERYISPCFINGSEAYDGEVNLEFDENLISNEYAVKLCLDYEFIINPEKDDYEPGVILGRSFLRLAHGVFDFGNGVIIIYPELYPFEDDFEKTGKSSDDWDQLLHFNFDDVPKFGEELPPFISKIGKRNSNKKRTMENLNLIYQDIKPSSSDGGHLTQEEAEKEALAVWISQKFALLEEERTAESDSDDEEEYVIKRNRFRAPIYGLKPASYLNCTNLEDRSSAIQTVTNPFRKISVWKKAVSFLGSLPVPLKQVNWKPDYKGSYTKEEEATRQSRMEIRLTDPYGNIYLQGFTTKKTDRKLSKYHKLSDIMSPN